MTKKTTARPATITTPSTVNATNMNKYDFYSILLQLIFFLILSFNLSIFFVSYKYIFCIDLSTLYKIKLGLLAAIFRGKNPYISNRSLCSSEVCSFVIWPCWHQQFPSFVYFDCLRMHGTTHKININEIQRNSITEHPYIWLYKEGESWTFHYWPLSWPCKGKQLL